MGKCSKMTSDQAAGTSGSNPASIPKRCIVVYCWGGISHFESWDPKPEAPDGIRSLWNPQSTNVPGTFITEKMPLLARMMDKVAVSRAVTKLIKSGRIDREFADADRRRSILNLSEDGRTVHDEIAPLALGIEADLLHGLTDEQIETLNGVIERLLARARLIGAP